MNHGTRTNIPYDPDFDPPTASADPEVPRGFFDNANPALAFLFGGTVALALISVTGFVVLLILRF